MTTWDRCASALLAKLIGQLSTEGLLTPTPTCASPSSSPPAPAVTEPTSELKPKPHLGPEGGLGIKPEGIPGEGEGKAEEEVPTGFELEFAAARYSFAARRGAFGSWRVDPGSIRRVSTGILGNDESEPARDPLRFLVDAAETLGIGGQTVAGFMAELTSTLAADVRIAESAVPNADLLDLVSRREPVDGHLTGHPLLVANKGRLGFSASDSARYAPEAREPFRLTWLAVRRGPAEFRGTPDLSEHAVLAHELDPATIQEFRSLLDDPDAYVWLPCHPWQVDRVIRTQWAPQLSTGEIVVLGEAPDRYYPTASIRTVVNADHPERYHVKLPLKILNTSVYRGIPEHCSLAAPMVTQWLRGLWNRDPLFARMGTELLGEVGSVTVRHPHLSGFPGVPYQWTETLGSIWREPLSPRLRDGETAWPLAAVLHLDRDGQPLLAELIERAGVDPDAWISELLAVLLRPLLRLMHHYGIAVNPHGENVVLILDADGKPARVAIKDLVDDVNVSTDPIVARGIEPDIHERVLPRKPWHVLRQYLVDALLLGVFGPMADLLSDSGLMTEQRFWGRVRGEVEAYGAAFPEHADRLQATGLLGETFARYPLNGYRLTSGYADLDTRPPVPVTGRIPNPLHPAPSIPPPHPY
jgi:siderophore synthetase component